MDWNAVRERKKQVVKAWEERMAEDPPRYPCHDCVQDYMMEWAGRTLEGIQKGQYWSGNGYESFLVCAEHFQYRSKPTAAV